MSCYNLTHFKEADEVLKLVHQISAPSSSGSSREAASYRVCACLEKYQQLPAVLDGYIPSIVSPLMDAALEDLTEEHVDRAKQKDFEHAEQEVLKSNHGQKTLPEKGAVSSSRLTCGLQIIYVLCKTRGYKVIVRCMPHEPYMLEPVCDYFWGQTQLLLTWSGRYVLLLWLSLLVRIPLSLSTMDSYHDGTHHLLTSLLRIVTTYLA